MNRLVVVVVVLLWVGVSSAQITDEVIESDGYHRYPGGIAIGDETRHFGCLNWDQMELCFFIDLNCNYIFEPDTERTMCECECESTTTTTSSTSSTSTSLASTTSTAPEPTTTTTSTTLVTTTTEPGATTTTSTSTTSTTSTTVADQTFADGLCATFLGLRGEHDTMTTWISPSDNEIIYQVTCHCEGTCSSPRAAIELTDQAGNVITPDSPLSCSTGSSASTYTAITADPHRQLDEGERLVISVTNTPASFDRINVCVNFEP